LFYLWGEKCHGQSGRLTSTGGDLSRGTRAYSRFFVQDTPHWISLVTSARGTRAHGRFLVYPSLGFLPS
jgi:hypothetical protein